MTAPLMAAILLAMFVALDVLGERLRGRMRGVPLGFLALGLAVAGMEFARYDHGHADWLLWIGYVGAPVVVIFGGAAWGVRRWYGWPDLGPMPGRLAGVSAALLVGILAGTSAKATDVEESMRRGDELAATLREPVGDMGGPHGHTFTPSPLTSMGLFDPPSFRWDREAGVLSFPIGGGREMSLDLRAPLKDARWTLR